MKRVFLFIVVFSIFTCSGGDDNNSVTINEDLVGAWFGTITDNEGSLQQTLTFNLDGTCSISNLWDDGETYFSSGTWSSSSSTITTTFGSDTETANYELSNNNNTCIVSRSNGVIIIYSRI